MEGDHFSDTWVVLLVNPHFSLNKKVKCLEKINLHIGGLEALNLDERQTNIKGNRFLKDVLSALKSDFFHFF